MRLERNFLLFNKFDLNTTDTSATLWGEDEESIMADRRNLLDKLIDAAKDKLSEVLGQLAPQPDAIPVPIRPDRRRRR